MSITGIPDVALIDNTSQRLPCVLVLDGSGSMTTGDAITQLNAGLKEFEKELKADDIASQRVQILVIRFGGDNVVEVVCDWTDAMDFNAPQVLADGLTPLGAAVTLALAKIEEQKARYRAHGIAYNRPWLFLLTDGEPTDQDWETAAAACRGAEAAEKVVVFGIGTGDANTDKLSLFSTRAPVRLQGLKFKELFIWLSRSAKVASKADQGSNVQMPAPIDWMQIPT